MIYCIAPRDLAAKAERAMRRYAGEHQVEVVAERRRRDRRATGERRNKPWPAKDPLCMVPAYSHEAEDATQQVFLQAMEALPRYELRAVPFRAWLFRIVRNYSIKHLAKHSRVEVEDPDELDRRRGAGEESQSAEMPA